MVATRTMDYGIVGGGILGMALALRLVEAGHTVTIYEAAPNIGGLAGPGTIGDVTWDRFYHVTLQSDTALLSLMGELGLVDDMQWRPTGTGLFHDGTLHPVSTAMDYLRLPTLGMASKVRIGATVLKAAHTSDWQALEQMTAEAWLTKWSGARAYESFWKPLLRAKLGNRHDEVSAAFIWAIMQRLYAARRANMKQDLFGYLPGGYARTLERFASVLESRGVSIRTSTRVETITTDGGRPVAHLADGTVSHDRIVVTLPSPIASAIIPALDADERRRHEAIAYQGIVCPSLLLDRPLSDYYVTNITDSSSPFTGIIEMTALVDRAEFGGRSLVYLPQYVPPDDQLFTVSDGEILDQSIAALSRMYPSFDRSQVVAGAVGQARHVLPLSTVGYSQRLPPMRTSVDGVFVVNSAHIVNGTLNVNETVELVGRSLPVVASGDRVESAP